MLLELSVRIYLFGWAGLIPSQINSVHGIPQADLTRRSSDARLAIELKPNLDTYFKLASFRTNSRGLRDREYPLRKPEDTFRVAVLGSSFALPAGVEIEAAFHSLLERELSGRAGGPRYEFINFAVGMYSPKQILAMLELRALAYDLDLILITATRLSAPLFAQPETPPSAAQWSAIPVFEKSYPILQSFLFRLLEQRLARDPATPPNSQLHVGFAERLFMDVLAWGARDSDDAMPRGGLATKSAGGRSDPTASEEESSRATILARLAAVGRRSEVPIVLIRLEIDPSDPPAIERELAVAAAALGLHYLDTRPAFRGTRQSDYWIYPLDPHPNARAHEIFAREIASFLDSEGLFPAMRGQ